MARARAGLSSWRHLVATDTEPPAAVRTRRRLCVVIIVGALVIAGLLVVGNRLKDDASAPAAAPSGALEASRLACGSGRVAQMTWEASQSALVARCTWSLIGWPSAERTILCIEGRWEGAAGIGETAPLAPCPARK